MKKRPVIYILLLCGLMAGSLFGQRKMTDSLEEGFINPPVSAKPKALWPWTNGNVSLSQITYELEEVKRKGMGGLDIWDIGTMVDEDSVVPAGPAFLGEESLQAIAYTLREAKRLGLEIGLSASSSWNAGGSWVKPEYADMGLFRSDTIVEGPANFSASIPFPAIPDKYGNRTTILYKDSLTGLPTYYKEVATLAHPLHDDSVINSSTDILLIKKAGGKIKWKVPAGKWRIVRYVCTPTGQPLAIPSSNSKGLVLDHFSAEAQEFNLEYIFKKLLPVAGPLRNSALKYILEDSYEVNSAIWTPALPEEFEKRNKYSLLAYLPVLDGFKFSGNKAERFLFDFRKTLSELIIENHYALGKSICEKYGIGYVAEAGGPGQPIHNVPFEDLKALGSLTVPRGEFWRAHPQLELLQIVKGISSASHIYNQKFVEAESFTSVWLWQEGPDLLKPLADRAMCEGLNRFVYHTFPHTPPESGNPGWVYNFGTLINTTNGWWPKSKGFHDYLARCSYLLQQGNFVGDVAFYYGDEAPNFVPPKKISPSLGQGYDYDVINTDVLLNKLSVKNERLFLPHGQSYVVLVLPETEKINLEVLKKISKLAKDGAVIIGPRPMHSYGLKNSQEIENKIREIADELWNTKNVVPLIRDGQTIREVLMKINITPDFQYVTADPMDTLDYIHRSTGDADIYFIRNVKDHAVNALTTFRIKDRQPEVWNPETGKIADYTIHERETNGIRVPLVLPAFGSTCFVFRKPLKRESGKMPDSSFLYRNTFAMLDDGLAVTQPGNYNFMRDGKKMMNEINVSLPIHVNQAWVLHFEKKGSVPGRNTMQKLIPLNQSTDSAIKYFSGTVAYQNNFVIQPSYDSSNEHAILHLENVKEIAEVFINGHNAGYAWHKPFTVDISSFVRKGVNSLLIEVVNTPNNALVGDAKFHSNERQYHSNITRLENAWRHPFAEAPLLEAGLIGPVSIVFVTRIE